MNGANVMNRICRFSQIMGITENVTFNVIYINVNVVTDRGRIGSEQFVRCAILFISVFCLVALGDAVLGLRNGSP